jgi:hypothetical protein
MAEPVIVVKAFFFGFGGKLVGAEEFTKGTNLDHIMSKMIQKYGQISSFLIEVPPVVSMKENK